MPSTFSRWRDDTVGVRHDEIHMIELTWWMSYYNDGPAKHYKTYVTSDSAANNARTRTRTHTHTHTHTIDTHTIKHVLTTMQHFFKRFKQIKTTPTDSYETAITIITS